jgi:hypothetical protein
VATETKLIIAIYFRPLGNSPIHAFEYEYVMMRRKERLWKHRAFGMDCSLRILSKKKVNIEAINRKC